MLKISKLADYATLVLQRLSLSAKESCSAADLAEQSNIAYPTVCKVLKQLAEAGLVQSQRGVRGGYSMTQSAQSVTLYDIVTAIDGEIALTECSSLAGDCVHSDYCDLSQNWQLVSRLLVTVLKAVTLTEMAQSFDMAQLLQSVQLQALPSSNQGSEEHHG